MTDPTAMPDPHGVLEHALAYAALGYRVVPIGPRTKHPVGLPNWQDAATSDPDTITTWFTGPFAGHGVGIATGHKAWALDVDVADGKRGDESLRDLEDSYHELPPTPEQTTGTGGRHLLFRWPDTIDVRNNQSGRLGPGLDIRGTGGQIVAAPTIHPNGQPYSWVDGHAPWEIEPADAPGWLYALLDQDNSPQPVTGPVTFMGNDTDGWVYKPTEPSDGNGPADRFNAATNWTDILTADGWTLHHTDRTGEQHWTRPGKERRDGTSATVGYKGADILKVFTSSVPALQADGVYSRFAYYAATRHRGDMSAAARDLIDQGHGRPAPAPLEAWTPTGVAAIAQELAATRTLPDTPSPLARNTSHGPPFPLHALPPWIADQCTAVAESFQVPVDLPAMLALGALSTVTAGHIKVRLTGTAWIEHTNLYLVVALPPGTGKSPVFKVMTRPVVDLEKDLIRQRKKDVAEHEAKRDILERQLKGAREIAVKGGAASVMDAVRIAGELDDLEQPPTGQMIGEDITPEALVETLATNNGRLALLSSEGGIFDMMAGQYAEKGRTANLAVYLQGWSADSIRRKRVKSEAQVIPEAVLTICVTTQPGVVSSLAANPELVTRGLPVRFMFSLPPSNIGGRNRYRVLDDLDQAIRSVYDDTLSRIGRHWAHMLNPTTLEFTHRARDIYLDWDQQTEQRLAPGGDLSAMAEWHSKLRSSILRLAGILQAANEPAASEPIDEHTLADAIEIGTYWLEHARLVHDMWRTEPDVTKARTIVDWAISNGTYEFRLRDVQAAKRGSFPNVDDVVPAVTHLIETGWVTPHQALPVRALGAGKTGQVFTLRHDAAVQLEATDLAAASETSQDCGEPARVARVRVSREINNPPTYPQVEASPPLPTTQRAPAQPAQPPETVTTTHSDDRLDDTATAPDDDTATAPDDDTPTQGYSPYPNRSTP